MPKIRLKPNSPEYDDGAPPKSRARRCDMPGCPGVGEHRAPKDRSLSEYYWFCFDHVREYNSAWNFFSGMQDSEVEKHIYESLYGGRPTWRYDTEGMAEEIRRKAWQTYNFTEAEPPPRAGESLKGGRQTPEAQALSVLGFDEIPVFEAIKARYRELVKKHHPDVNRGNPKSEEIIKKINMAYTILKLAYEHVE